MRGIRRMTPKSRVKFAIGHRAGGIFDRREVWLRLRAASRLSIRVSGIGSPVRRCRAHSRSVASAAAR
jgi:hypothetical protein